MVTDLHHPNAMTVDQWADMAEDEEGELVDGVLVEEEMPDALHEVIVAWLVSVLRAWLVSRGGGLVFASELKFAVAKRRGRKPDVSLYLAKSKKPPRRGVVRVPPDLMVEVLSPRPRDARRDRIDKPDEYARFGVKRYWIIDPEARTFEAYALNARRKYVRVLGATEGRVTVPDLERLSLDLDDMWAATDQLT